MGSVLENIADQLKELQRYKAMYGPLDAVEDTEDDSGNEFEIV
jgi:hypothetical protein